MWLEHQPQAIFFILMLPLVIPPMWERLDYQPAHQAMVTELVDLQGFLRLCGYMAKDYGVISHHVCASLPA